MKNAFAIVTLSALMSACAVTPPANQGQDGQAQVPAPPALESAAASNAVGNNAAQAASQPERAAASSEGALPNVALSSDMLYRLTKAELEFKNGQWQGPYMTMMSAAQQTRDPRLAKRATEMALSAKQGSEAMAAVRLWRELAPDSDEAAQYFLGFVVLSDQMEEAEPLFVERLQKATPALRPAMMFQMYQFLSRARDKLLALAMLERVLAPYGEIAESHLVQAQALSALGENQRAVAKARQALTLKPGSELAILTLAQVSRDPEEIGAMLARFLEKNPNASEVRNAYARVLIEQKQYGPARQQFLVLLKAQPDSLANLYALGILSMQLKEAPAAEKWFKQFLATQAAKPDPEADTSKVLHILAQIAEERGDVKGALAWLDQIDGSEARRFNARVKRAQLMARHGDLAGGRKILAELQTSDIEGQALLVLSDAQLLRDAGLGQDAFTVLESGLQRFPQNVELLYDFALAAEKLGKMDLMEASLRKVMTLAPDNHHAYNALGYSLAERNVRLPEAFSLIEKALKMAPGDPFIMDSMGWVQFRMGRLQEAEDVLRRAYTLRSDPEIGVHLGEVLWQKGEKEQARTLWREARSKDPQNDALKNTLVRLNTSL